MDGWMTMGLVYLLVIKQREGERRIDITTGSDLGRQDFCLIKISVLHRVVIYIWDIYIWPVYLSGCLSVCLSFPLPFLC